MPRRPQKSTLFPYTTLFRSGISLSLARTALVPPAANQICSGRYRSEEHTSELQSPDQIVCRVLLEKTNIDLKASNGVESVTPPSPVALPPLPAHDAHYTLPT